MTALLENISVHLLKFITVLNLQLLKILLGLRYITLSKSLGIHLKLELWDSQVLVWQSTGPPMFAMNSRKGSKSYHWKVKIKWKFFEVFVDFALLSKKHFLYQYWRITRINPVKWCFQGLTRKASKIRWPTFVVNSVIMSFGGQVRWNGNDMARCHGEKKESVF